MKKEQKEPKKQQKKAAPPRSVVPFVQPMQPHPAHNFDKARRPGQSAAGRERLHKFEASRRAAKAKPVDESIGVATRFGDVEVGRQLVIRPGDKDPTIYTKTEPYRFKSGPHRGRISEILYHPKRRDEPRRAFCSDQDRIVYVLDTAEGD